MNTRKYKILSFLILIVLTMLACTVNIGGPSYPEQRVPVSTDAIAEFQSAVQTAVPASVQSGQITLIITESQLTSYLAQKLQAQPNPLISDPQAYLRDGQIQLYGTAHQGYFEATAAIVLTAGIDEQGQLKIELSSADFGPLPIPNGLKEIVTETVQEAYTGAIGPAATGFRLESIVVADGTMTIVGRIK